MGTLGASCYRCVMEMIRMPLMIDGSDAWTYTEPFDCAFTSRSPRSVAFAVVLSAVTSSVVVRIPWAAFSTAGLTCHGRLRVLIDQRIAEMLV